MGAAGIIAFLTATRRLHSFSRGNSSENLNIDNYNNKRLLQKAFYQEFELAQTLVDESKRQVLRGNKIKHGGGRKYVNVRTMDFDSWGNKLIQVETTEKFKRGATVPYETECYSRKLYSSKTGKVTFELTVGNYDWGVRHYDKDGNDDTKTYLKHLNKNTEKM